MRFSEPLIPGTLLRRYKRFLADVELVSGEVITCHCPNSGSMATCQEPGWPVRLSDSHNPTRKLRLTWEMVHNGRCWIGINTHLANRLAAEALRTGVVTELAGYESLRTEVRYGQGSRVDILLEHAGEHCFVEVKNVTLLDDRGRFTFPDAPTARGRKHLRELQGEVAAGNRAAVLFLIQRSDGRGFAPADHIDPDFAAELRRAAAAGVEVLAYRAEVNPEEITVVERVPVELG